MRNQNLSLQWALPAAGMAVILLVLTGFLPPENANNTLDTSTDAPDNQEATAYRAELSAIDNSGVTGTATFIMAESGFKVQVNAKGLEAGTHRQHIHTGSSCSDFGGVLLPLEPFPEATGGGTVNYQSGELTAPENLADRTIVVHDATEEGAAVACGEINPAKKK